MEKHLGIMDELCGKEFVLGCIQAHRTEKEKKTMTTDEQFVMEGNEKADE